MRLNNIVPLSMERVAPYGYFLHLLRGYFSARGILAAIQPTSHAQSFGGGGLGNQLHDRLVVSQVFDSPVRGNERKHSMLDLVPLVGALRKVADRQG